MKIPLGTMLLTKFFTIFFCLEGLFHNLHLKGTQTSVLFEITNTIHVIIGKWH